MDDLEVLADDLMARGSEVVEVLEAAGLEVALARGEGDYCQMVPVQGLTFAFGGALTEDVAYAERFRVARDAMVDQGWEVVVEGEYARRGERPHPYVELEREDHRLSLDLTALEGSDALVFGLTRDDDCVRVPGDGVQLPEDLEEVVLVE
ncbi:hypothetical protein BKA08_001798 [Nocardioides marinisabuli]|uniref:Uncharacterized protein n=1 Tax=Nocardioides marinisabuli TaxID=419476 RepID=A0A7Y9F2K2_9ACTN|nr:hypothetical protein [Nocardioides marinisabuli]NYD57560.1 hypothetical protein [Nocardioides marinisabuli]